MDKKKIYKISTKTTFRIKKPDFIDRTKGIRIKNIRFNTIKKNSTERADLNNLQTRNKKPKKQETKKENITYNLNVDNEISENKKSGKYESKFQNSNLKTFNIVKNNRKIKTKRINKNTLKTTNINRISRKKLGNTNGNYTSISKNNFRRNLKPRHINNKIDRNFKFNKINRNNLKSKFKSNRIVFNRKDYLDKKEDINEKENLDNENEKNEKINNKALTDRTKKSFIKRRDNKFIISRKEIEKVSRKNKKERFFKDSLTPSIFILKKLKKQGNNNNEYETFKENEVFDIDIKFKKTDTNKQDNFEEKINNQVSSEKIRRELLDKQKISKKNLIKNNNVNKNNIGYRTKNSYQSETKTNEEDNNNASKKVANSNINKKKLSENNSKYNKRIRTFKEHSKEKLNIRLRIKEQKQKSFSFGETSNAMDKEMINSVYKVQETKRTLERVKQTAKVVEKTALFIGKILKQMLASLLASKTAIVLIVLVVLITVIASFSSMQGGILPIYIVLVEDDVREEIKQIVDELNGGYLEDIEEISNTANENTEVKVVGGVQGVDYRYILCILAVVREQEFDISELDEILEDVERIFKLFNSYSVQSETEIVQEEREKQIINQDGTISTEIEIVDVEKTKITVTVESKSILIVADELGFDDEQIEWLLILLSSEFENEFDGDIALNSNSQLTELETEELMLIIDSITDPNRKELILTALQLLGKTGYLWGGKAPAGGMPLGLDCSGFTDWVYKTALGYSGLSGGGTAYQFNVGQSISKSELKAGDIGFWKLPSSVGGGQSDANHTGIYIGTLADGRAVYIHSEGGRGVTISAFPFAYHSRINEANLN